MTETAHTSPDEATQAPTATTAAASLTLKLIFQVRSCSNMITAAMTIVANPFMTNNKPFMTNNKAFLLAVQTISYIRKEWKDRKKLWAAYARLHSAILLQINTTNGVENFHSVIKKHNSGKSLRQKYSITGLVAHLLALGERIQEEAKRSAPKFRTQHLKKADELPQLKRFPLPVQKLIVEELDALRQMGDEDLIVSTKTRYNRTYEILTEDHWNNFVFMFENRGFDVYEGRGQEPAREGDRGDIGAPARRALTLKETLERLRSRYYELRRELILSSGKT
ncbi:hypothetical protein V1520DRAFT_372265 [Lipomyces starkeyi]|uniref:Uncharacterized protein n=1 Tax=Lipomyces starkeyi NRRL Y-11557 TaxID=675824 RepID=A0A1E3PV25_LIPST|nr:hypothetical protein LIPSTDRAFT_7166 [Lipomyces starkeyi NRRL Y-11557]